MTYGFGGSDRFSVMTRESERLDRHTALAAQRAYDREHFVPHILAVACSQGWQHLHLADDCYLLLHREWGIQVFAVIKGHSGRLRRPEQRLYDTFVETSERCYDRLYGRHDGWQTPMRMRRVQVQVWRPKDRGKRIDDVLCLPLPAITMGTGR